MDQTEELRKRGEALKAKIEAASKRLAEEQKMESSEIGNILESFSREIEASHHASHEEKTSVYDRLESEIDSVFTRISAARSVE